MNIASVRILRLALGTAVSLWFSQAVNWPLSFIAPVITMFVLALPLPAPKLKGGIGLIAILTISLFGGLLLLPTLTNQPMVGILLLILALYWSFYFTAKGGSAVIGTFATVGIAVSTAIGTVNLDAVLAISSGVSFGAAIGVLFVWVAHALLPDSMAKHEQQAAAKKTPAPPKPDLSAARWSAFRSLMIIMPVALWFLFSSASTAYVPVMIKAASMGQQATNDGARKAGHSLVMSTIIGGAGAIIGWQILSIAPTLPVYTLVIAIAGLLMGPKIFQGQGMHPQAATWSYAFLTMIVILAPAVMDSAAGDPAGIKFWQRLLMFGGTTIYAVGTVYIFDAFTASRSNARQTEDVAGQ
jgi:hypothetical protein